MRLESGRIMSNLPSPAYRTLATDADQHNLANFLTIQIYLCRLIGKDPLSIQWSSHVESDSGGASNKR